MTPEETANFEKNWIQSFQSGAQQPTAQLQETQAAAGAAGASAARSTQQTAISQRELKQQKFIKDTQSLFDEVKDTNGHVSPDIFNKMKQASTELDIDGKAFDSTFEQGGYVDPQKVINYNTATGLDNQNAYGQIKRRMQAQLDQYHSIPPLQKGLFSEAQLQGIPLIGQILAPHAFAYEQSRRGLPAQMTSIVGGGYGTGLRVNNYELDRWANLIPASTDTPEVANDKIAQIDREIKATFNTPTGLDPKYLPNKGRPPLSSFGH